MIINNQMDKIYNHMLNHMYLFILFYIILFNIP